MQCTISMTSVTKNTPITTFTFTDSYDSLYRLLMSLQTHQTRTVKLFST